MKDQNGKMVTHSAVLTRHNGAVVTNYPKDDAKNGRDDLTLLSDTDGEVIRAYHADHWLLPVAKRVFIIVDQDRNIVFRRDTGLSVLPNQTEPLIRVIDTYGR